MSDSDSFIEEVSEAVRRDRLFRLFKRWGWIPITLVVLIVAGAAWNEWRKAQAQAAAEARGTAILEALEPPAASDRLTALRELAGGEHDGAVLRMLIAAVAKEAEDPAAAVAALEAIENDPEAAEVYRQMAALKRLILTAGETEPEERIAALTPLTVPGGAFRVLAEEQIALAEIENGDIEDALARLRALTEDTEASGPLRQRATQLIIALGGNPDAA